MTTLVLALTLAAQGPQMSHAPIPSLDPTATPDDLLRRRLGQLRDEKSNEQLRRLIENFQRNPNSIDPALLDSLRNDPAIRQALEQFRRDHPHFVPDPSGRPPAEMLSELEKLAREILEARAQSSQPSRLPPDQFRSLSTGTPASSDLERAIAEKFTSWLKSAETSDTWSSLRKSPTFRQALEEFGKLASRGRNSPDLGGPKWLPNSDRLASWVRSLDLSRLPRLPRVRMPAVSVPATGGASEPGWRFSEVGFGSVGLVAAAVAGLVALVRLWPYWRSAATAAAPDEPIDPNSVESRDTFLRTFERIIVKRHGEPARRWNHRVVADHLQGQPYSRELMRHYELGRYAPIADQPTDWAATRPWLAELAGNVR